MLSHIMHPAPEVPSIDFNGKLKGLIVVAPWVSFRMDFNSVKKNAWKDILTEEVGNRWSGGYMAGKDITPYANALIAEPSWWKNPAVEHILCVAGGDEMIHDSITEWVDKYQVCLLIYTLTKTNIAVCEWGRKHHVRRGAEGDPHCTDHRAKTRRQYAYCSRGCYQIMDEGKTVKLTSRFTA